MENRITELEAEIVRLKSEIEKARERERNIDETRRAMLLMLEDLERSQESLSRAKHEWEAAFDGISDPLFVHDRDFKIVRANRAYAMASGMDIKEITGKVYYEVFPKMEGPFKMCLKAREEEEEEEFSYPVTNKIFKIRFYPIKDVNGGYLYSIHILEDITEAKRAADMLQRAYSRLSTLYNIDRSVSQSLDLNELLKNGLSMTLKALEIEGGAITLIDPDGKTMTIRTHSGLSEEFVNIVRHINIDEDISGRAIAGRKPVILNISEYPTERLAPFIIKEGFQTLVSTPLISAGKVLGALTLATHKIKAFPPEETELLTSIGVQLGTAVQNTLLYQSMMISEERYRGLVETSADAIVSINDAREIVQWNDSASRIFGYSKDEIMGKLIDTIIPEEYKVRHIEGFKRYIETGEGKVIGKVTELKGLRKDGFIVPIELSLSVLKSDKSYVFAGIIRDLTERKQAEQEIIQQQKLATMGHLVSGITHEIKNPLGIILGYVQMLSMDEQDAEKKKIYEIVLQQIDRSVKIIDNLLGFARRREYEIKDININNLIESTIKLVEYEMKLENIIFIRDFKKDLPLIKGDADQLAQVFLNLINNARDSMNEKQKRIKSGELKAEGWKGEIKITTKKTNNRIEITFADTGLGILEDKVTNIFKPFFTTKAEGKGTGLGLSIAKDIIEKYGGKIELENKVGEGVKFIITLPVS
jgi:PAS domain S-box-containing protein